MRSSPGTETEDDPPLTRLEWFHELRRGWTPMVARFAWTQALIYQGKRRSEVFAFAHDDPERRLLSLTLSAYRRGAEQSVMTAHPIGRLLKNRSRR